MHVVITGASSGLGEALARRFAARGASLTLVARREDRLRALAASVDVPTLVRPADLTRLEGLPGVVRDARAAHGPIDVWVNNAGMQALGPLQGVDPRRAARLLTLNLHAPLSLMQLVLPEMVARGSGTVVNVASVAAITPMPWMAWYAAAKAGLASASEAVRAELRGTGVNVLTVYPGPFASDMELEARQALGEDAVSRAIPQGTPDGLARRIVARLRRSRVIYPRFYWLAWRLPRLAQWLTHAFDPGLREAQAS